MNDELLDKLMESVKGSMSTEDISEIEEFGTNVMDLVKEPALMGAVLGSVLGLDPVVAHANSIVKGMWMYREILDKVDPMAVIAVDKYLREHREETK